jgi:hypothetical protein
MMAPPGQPQRSVPRPPRPGTVRAAVYLQVGVVVLLLATLAAVAVMTVLWNDIITQAARNTSADPQIVSGERFGSVSMAVVLGGFSLGLALWFGILAVPLWRGANTARILTAVGAGVPVLCALCQGGSGLLVMPFLLGAPQGPPPDVAPDGPDAPTFENFDAFYAELDRLSTGFRWLTIAGPVMALVVFGCILALTTLLFMPSANRYFRPEGPRRVVQYVPVPYPVYWPYPVPPGAATPSPTAPTSPEGPQAPETPPDPRS